MSLWLEKYYPLLAALVAWLGWLYFAPTFPSSEKEFLGAAIGIGAILAGFIATAIAILAALPSDSVMDRIKSSGYVEELMRYMVEALYTCLGFSAFGMFGFFLIKGEGQEPALNGWYSGAWIFLATYSLLSFHRVANVLVRIIKFKGP